MTQPPHPGPDDPQQPGEPTDPPPPNPYGAGQPPAYPQPYGAAPAGPQQPPTPYAGNPYGGNPYGGQQPPAPYANPYANPYGATYPGGPGSPEPASKGLAITSLVLSFLACTIVAGLVSLVMAIVVLVKGRGRDNGKGMAIAAIVIDVVTIPVVLIGVVAGVMIAEEQSLSNLEVGECINADDLTDPDASSIGLIEKVGCTEPHDGEIVATTELTAEQAERYDSFDCAPYIDDVLLGRIDPATYSVFSLADSNEPGAGDAVACVLVRRDGEKLTQPAS